MKAEEKNLIRRYLIWCYKTTKEELDRIDRKFTQLKVDYFMLDELKKMDKKTLVSSDYAKLLSDFIVYIENKEKDAQESKFSDSKKQHLNSRYLFLRNRLSTIEKAIIHFLGPKQKIEIARLYEEEMTRRILESREHT